MITIDDILETNRMITENKLDVRTITMGISLRDCAHPNIDKFCQNVYDKITKSAEFLVKTGEDIEAEYGIPIIHKRISVTPIAIAADACETDTYVPVAETVKLTGRSTPERLSFKPVDASTNSGAETRRRCRRAARSSSNRRLSAPMPFCVSYMPRLDV